MTAERKDGVIFGIKSEQAGATSAVAVSLMRNITQVDRDGALEQAIAGLVADARRSAPNSYPGGGAPGRDDYAPLQRSGGGERPIEPLPGIAAIDRMVEAFQPHGAANPEFRGAIPQAALRRAVAAARAVLAEEAALKAEAAPEAVAQAPEPVLAAEAVAAPAAGTLTRRRLA